MYGFPFSCVKETNIQCFQYKLLHRFLPSNKFLCQIRYIDKPNCSFCGNEDETLEHLFFSMPVRVQFVGIAKNVPTDQYRLKPESISANYINWYCRPSVCKERQLYIILKDKILY